MKIIDLGTIEYAKAWDEQKIHFERLLANPDTAPEVAIMCEHPHVYTLGRSGSVNNLLINDQFLESIGATYFKTDRGGDITYHGYGQLVVYPILNLTRHGLSLKEYIHALEQIIIEVVEHYGIKADRLEGATGVWIEGQNPLNPQIQGTRKIAAIGVKASRFVTMHGIALNVNTDLSYFNHINPCGFVDKGVTSIERETGGRVEMGEVKRHFEDRMRERFL